MRIGTIKVLLLASVAMSLFPGCRRGDQSTADRAGENAVPYVEKIHDDLEGIISDDAVVQVLAEGFEWTEGPLWLPGHDVLLFTDIPANSIYRWHQERGTTLYLRPSGYTGDTGRGGEEGANGLLLDDEGRLVLCQHGDRRIARMNAPLHDPVPEFETLAATWEGKRYNSPNDAVLHSNGDLYFTDPPYGLERGAEDPAKEIPFQGVFVLRTNGKVDLLTDELSRPNGIGFAPDEHTLYVANSDKQAALVMAYDVGDNGTLSRGRVFADMSEAVKHDKGLPDGMAVHSLGYVFATGPGGVWVFGPEGTLLGKVRTLQATSNCTLGNNEGFLYITADMYVQRVALNPKGAG